MQEHFNENYMYSSKFPKSTFEGVIQNFNFEKLENNYANFIIEGEIEIKGVKKNISTVARIKKTDDGIDLNTSFNIQGEPIVCSVEDALKNFFLSGLDLMYIDNFIIEK